MANAIRLICILGMHRSGTSCVTGSLQQAGLFLGNCHEWNRHNTKGNRENQDFVDLNDEVLAANGGAWDSPPRKSVWSPAQLDRARALLLENSGEASLGFKDPRTLLVLEGWKKVCPEIQFVGVVRHPNVVAQSLQTRSEMRRDQALSLWYAYNRRLLKECKRNPFPILCFDEEEELFHQKLGTVVRKLGLRNEFNEQRFYDEQLRNSNKIQRQTSDVLPWKVKRLYGRLLRLCL